MEDVTLHRTVTLNEEMDFLDTKSRSSSIQIFCDMKMGFIGHYYSFMVFGCALTTVPAIHNLQQSHLTVGTGRCAKRESHKLKTILEEIATILKEELQNAMSNFFLAGGAGGREYVLLVMEVT